MIVQGELDLATAGRLLMAVDVCAPEADDLVLDCRELTFVDGAGARALLDIAAGLPNGRQLVLQGLSGLVLRVIRLLRLDSHPRIVLRT
ncbi:MAG: STAS domain-containing protein [Actinomycetota bacterium]